MLRKTTGNREKMVVINIFRPEVVVGRGPSWSKKGLVMRRYNPMDSPTRLQVQAMLNLASAARNAASQTTGLSGATRVVQMNRIVSEQLAGRGAGGGGYAQKFPSVGRHGPGWLVQQAAKHGLGYAGRAAAPLPGFAGGGGMLW